MPSSDWLEMVHGTCMSCGTTDAAITAGQDWISVRFIIAGGRDQGWKLHVSSCCADADAVLRRSVPVLLRRKANFKFAASSENLRELNEGTRGLTQVGKFITIYPASDSEAVELAALLDECLAGLRGPAIPGDRRLRRDSLVHYRYGGFRKVLMQTPLGEIVPAIRDQEGVWRPDVRGLRYIAPLGVEDPFESNGLAGPEEEGQRVVGDRYWIISTLYEGPRGAVYLALDFAEPKRCILKRFKEHSLADHYGRPAKDRLHHEAEVLLALQDIEAVPRCYGTVQSCGDHYLVVEDVEGISLERLTNARRKEGHYLSFREIGHIGRQLISILERIHSRGFVYRDLKSAHIFQTEEGEVKIIDFDLAYSSSSMQPAFGLGTRGYMSPQQSRGERPDFRDDVYSFGAMLYGLVTATEPSTAPCPDDLLGRPVLLLRPDCEQEWVDVIKKCLEPDKTKRFTSFTELGNCWRVLEEQSDLSFARETPRCAAEEPKADVQTEAKKSAALVAEALLAELSIGASAADNVWVSRGGPSGDYKCRDVAIGNAGTLIALCELCEGSADVRTATAMRGIAEWLARPSPFAGNPLPGLYMGEAGVALALLKTGVMLGDDHLVDTALRRSRALATLPFGSPDLYHGTAGRARFHLYCWETTSDGGQLAAAIEAGDQLLQAEQQVRGESFWPIPAGYGDLSGHSFYGYAHGAAGIADVLLDLFEATGEERYALAAQRVAFTLRRAARILPHDSEAMAWPISRDDEKLAPAFWCHGSTGIGHFFVHAALAGIDNDAKVCAHMAAVAAARLARWAGPTLCHGLAGNILFLLKMYEAMGRGEYLEWAWSLAEILKTFEMETPAGHVWAPDDSGDATPDLLIGYAGIGICLLRLSKVGKMGLDFNKEAAAPL